MRSAGAQSSMKMHDRVQVVIREEGTRFCYRVSSLRNVYDIEDKQVLISVNKQYYCYD